MSLVAAPLFGAEMAPTEIAPASVLPSARVMPLVAGVGVPFVATLMLAGMATEPASADSRTLPPPPLPPLVVMPPIEMAVPVACPMIATLPLVPPPEPLAVIVTPVGRLIVPAPAPLGPVPGSAIKVMLPPLVVPLDVKVAMGLVAKIILPPDAVCPGLICTVPPPVSVRFAPAMINIFPPLVPPLALLIFMPLTVVT